MNRMTNAQRDALWDLCGRYHVPFAEDDYFVFSAGSIAGPPGYAEGWVGGVKHSVGPEQTIYVGVSPEGDIHS